MNEIYLLENFLCILCHYILRLFNILFIKIIMKDTRLFPLLSCQSHLATMQSLMVRIDRKIKIPILIKKVCDKFYNSFKKKKK